ncbi:hypothetical protein QTI66_31680 [Variovorax sp. J22R133]|uniref:hypothetical protein n=1 Tax=Variovorax brevis TaxID=3053503 RepID=UPI002577FD81|nr:hypothetical protein [Variovorax sp. J22R133]MDM0116701.1 hypothetical protein [Variovorax sp. J22R133]
MNTATTNAAAYTAAASARGLRHLWPLATLSFARRGSRAGAPAERGVDAGRDLAGPAAGNEGSGFGSRAARLARKATGLRFRRTGLNPVRASDAPIRPIPTFRAASTENRGIGRARASVAMSGDSTPASLDFSASSVSRRLQALMTKRPVDLVWRARSGASSAAGDASLPSTSRETFRRSMARAPAAHSTPVAADTSAAQPSTTSAVCATTLDPALANRLADDIIRRIDQRARIERERHGH